METQYRVMPVEEPHSRKLIQITGERNLVSSYDAFGPNTFNENVAEMQNQSFKEPTTAESIFIGACNPRALKSQILNLNLFQLGRIVRWDDGIYINMLEAIRNGELDLQILRQLRDKAKPVNGIRLGERDFAFVPYGFKTGKQSGEDFVRRSLARGLEYVRETALNLGRIASENNYPQGVYVWGFDSVKEPVLRVASLDSNWSVSRRLYVTGNDWNGGDGYAFGVL